MACLQKVEHCIMTMALELNKCTSMSVSSWSFSSVVAANDCNTSSSAWCRNCMISWKAVCNSLAHLSICGATTPCDCPMLVSGTSRVTPTYFKELHGRQEPQKCATQWVVSLLNQLALLSRSLGVQSNTYTIPSHLQANIGMHKIVGNSQTFMKKRSLR